jgi:hypothetical protein
VITKNPVRVGAEVVDGPAAGDFLAHRSQKLQVPTTSCGDKAAALDLLMPVAARIISKAPHSLAP